MKKFAALSQDAVRRQLLARVRNAEFPRDFASFTSQELNAAGLLRRYGRETGWNDATFRKFVLFAVQAEELRKQSAERQQQIELSKEYHSPFWETVWNEPCPLREAELRSNAEADQARGNEQRRKERNAPLASILSRFRDGKYRNWKFRDQHWNNRPTLPVSWHEPMSVTDYHDATGFSRRTIQNVIYRLRAKPIAQPKRRNEPARYGQQTNCAVLGYWLLRKARDQRSRRGWLARVLVHCQHETPKHYRRLFESLRPVLRSAGIESAEQHREFAAYLGHCMRVLHPPPPPLPFHDGSPEALGISGLFGTSK